MKKALITGITGQDGAYLSRLLLRDSWEVTGVLDPGRPARLGKLKHLGTADDIAFRSCSLADKGAVRQMVREEAPDIIFNLAAQSSVGASFADPIGTIEFNVLSVVNLLEVIRAEGAGIRFYQASSSEMYGAVDRLPVTETTPMHPRSPYAVSKAAAHWTTVNYRESYDLFACCGILFNHESFLRGDNFFVKKIVIEALDVADGLRNEMRVGNLDVRRDFGYSPEYVKAMYAIATAPMPGDYLVCSGRSISLREILGHVLKRTGLSWDIVTVDKALYRPVDIADMYGNNSKACKELGWHYDMDFLNVLDILIEEERQYRENEKNISIVSELSPSPPLSADPSEGRARSADKSGEV